MVFENGEIQYFMISKTASYSNIRNKQGILIEMLSLMAQQYIILQKLTFSNDVFIVNYVRE